MLLCARIYGSMGVQLDQLAQVFQDPFHFEQDILTCVLQQEEKLKQQQQHIRLCLQRTQDIRRAREDVERSRRAPIREKRKRCGAYMLQKQCGRELLTEDAVCSEFARWTQHPEFLFSAGRIGREALVQNREEFLFGIGVEERYARMMEVHASEYVRYFPPQMCLYTVIETTNKDPLCFGRIRRLLRDLGIDEKSLADDVTSQTILMTRNDSGYKCFHGIYIPLDD